VFPNADVIKLLIQCGVDVNIKNEAKSTPLHVACQPYNYDNEVSGSFGLLTIFISRQIIQKSKRKI